MDVMPLWVVGLGDEECEEAAGEALSRVAAAAPASDAVPAARWEVREGGGMQVVHRHSLSQITWHSRGDYFATVAPTANTQVPPLGKWLDATLNAMAYAPLSSPKTTVNFPTDFPRDYASSHRQSESICKTAPTSASSHSRCLGRLGLNWL